MHNIYRRTRSDDGGYGTCLATSFLNILRRTHGAASTGEFLNFLHRNTISSDNIITQQMLSRGDRRGAFSAKEDSCILEYRVTAMINIATA